MMLGQDARETAQQRTAAALGKTRGGRLCSTAACNDGYAAMGGVVGVHAEDSVVTGGGDAGAGRAGDGTATGSSDGGGQRGGDGCAC